MINLAFTAETESVANRLETLAPAIHDAGLSSTLPCIYDCGDDGDFEQNAHNDTRLIRLFDVVVSMAIFILVLPSLVILALLLKIDSKGPIFFVQRRIGRNGKTFPCFKFRTMHVNAAALLTEHLERSSAAREDWAANFKLRDDPRITRLGKMVRKLSLDEFPQLINIIRGEMSLVGPRPIVSGEIPLYGRTFADYCRVRPGLTGLWQVSGRNDVEYCRRVSMDRYYVRRQSVLLNVRILFATVPAVLFARGSS